MENSSTEGLSSTANHHSFASGAGSDGNASEESGWTSYIDYFMETQRRRQQEEASPSPSSARGSTTQYSDDYYVGGGSSSRLPALVEPSEASRRLISLRKDGRRRKKKVVVYDESLEDTATSPISSPKLIELRESDANHQKKEDARDEFSHYKIRTTSAELVAGYNNLSNNGANTITTDMIDDDCEYDSNELRKKGLCIVPVSAFHV